MPKIIKFINRKYRIKNKLININKIQKRIL